MNLSLSPYQLQLKSQDEVRSGYLLRLQSSDGFSGYSDIFPWPVFSDPSFEDIPRILKEATTLPPLLERSIEMASLDLEARRKKVSLMKNIELTNHFLVTNMDDFKEIEEAVDNGFIKIKLKCGRNLKKEISFLSTIYKQFRDDLLLRLDFNGMLNREDENLFYPYLDMMEFVEDPYSNPKDWIGSSFSLAYDHPNFTQEEVDFDWQIIKPAKQKNPQENKFKIIFTSYLGHPVGMAQACYQAQVFGKQMNEYGLMSDHVYEKTPFHEWIIKRGPCLSFELGLGIGFDSLLEGCVWRPL